MMIRGEQTCGTHITRIQTAIAKRKSEDPDYRRGVGFSKLSERLTRMEILRLLGVDEDTVMKTVSKLKPPYDFKESLVGTFGNEDERRALKSAQFKGKHFLGGGKTEAYCSVFLITSNDSGEQELVMFRTETKHPMGELQVKMSSTIMPRLKEILFARKGYPYREWADHVSYDGYDFHYE